MMATAEPQSSSSFLPLLQSLEDNTARQSDQTDAYLTIANRLSGEEGRQFLPAVEKHFCRLGKVILAHINSPNAELSQAALQALGFCVYHSHVASAVPEAFAAEILSALCSLVVKSTDKNTCTRSLWVISKQSFPSAVVGTKVPSVLTTLESVWSREDVQSVVMEHEALNVVIRMLDQVPTQMGEGSVRWAKLVIPLVVHSAPKVRLRAAAALEMGMPLLLERQTEIAAIIEPMMSSKLVPELQKLFMSKNETNVLKLWPLFVKLLGKLLHRGGPFINSLLHLEELGFRSSSPTIKKIAFIAWKSLIDNFAINPDILCSSKRMKLLMQPLASINVRTEALLLTKVEVWWYLVVQLGPNLSSNFEQVSVPLLQCTIGSDAASVPGISSRGVNQNGSVAPGTPKTSTAGFSSPAATPRISLNSSMMIQTTFSSIQLLGLEMLLHYFLGPDVVAAAAKNKLILSLEPLNHPFLTGASSFTKHASVLISHIRDGFTCVGKEAQDSLLALIWTSLVRFVNLSIESGGSKKDRQGCEVLTLMLQALQSIVMSEALPADRVLVLFEATVKGIPQRVLGSASYQVGKMDVLNGTPALFLILLLYDSSMLPAYIEDERFFQCLQTLVSCGLSGPTSPLAFSEAVLGAIRRSSGSLQNKEQLWKMWTVLVSQLTDTITQSNEVNQGDALEHNFSAVHSALLLPITHLLCGTPLQQASQKSMLSTWSKLYKVFARCSALVVTAEENICCEELCAKVTTALDKEALKAPSTLNAVASILQVMVECVNFSPYTPQFQQQLKSPHTPVNWMRKKNKVLGNLFTFQSLLGQCLDVFLKDPEASSEATGAALTSIISALFTNLVLANAVREVLTSLIQPLTLFYKQATNESNTFTPQVLSKLEKLLTDILSCMQTRSTFAYDTELLTLLSPLLCVLFPHKNKQLRASITQFWNSTFGNSVSLTYPDELRPILSQVKQKTPIILPGFEVITVPDDLSGQYSGESSQLETKLSGIPVSSVGKRDSLLGKASEMKDGNSAKTSKPVPTKLDFSSPKPPRRQILEEEASIDFVFIPPETKERVLTEHQKEVKRTKRVDIPAMYNNLDASLDTTVFTQYTQSPEDSMDKLPTEQADKVTEEASGKVSEADGTENTLDYASPNAAAREEIITEDNKQEESVLESADDPMENDAQKDETEDNNSQSKESPSLNVSSDLVIGTPQKPSSRRQSFITLEKYAEGKLASPSNASSFTGPLIKTLNSQETGNATKTSPTLPSQTANSATSQSSSHSPTEKASVPADNAPDSPRLPKDSKTLPVVKLTERLPCDTTEDEDIIPDTQTEDNGKEKTRTPPRSEEKKLSSQEEESDQTLDDSQSSQTSSGEPRRSGRSRVRPLLPGEDPQDREEKFAQIKRKRSGEDKSDSQSSLQGRPNTRSKLAAEEESSRLQTRSRRSKSESSQTNSQVRAHKRIKLYSSSQDFLDKPETKRRSNRESSQSDIQSDTQSDHESQSKGRRHRSSPTNEAEGAMKRKDVPKKVEPVKTATQEPVEQKDEPKKDVEMISPQTEGVTQEDVEQAKKDQEVGPDQKDSPVVTPPTDGESQSIPESQETQNVIDEKLSQEDSQAVTTSSSDSQSRRRSRRSQASSEAADSEENSENKALGGRRSRSSSQTESRTGGRSTRSSPISTTENSQSPEVAGSEESSQRTGRSLRRRSSQSLVAGVETSESESSENRENVLTGRRGRSKKLSPLSPQTIEAKGDHSTTADSDVSQKADSQKTQKKNPEDSQKSRDLQNSESLDAVASNEQSQDVQMEVEVDAAVASESPETDSTSTNQPLNASPSNKMEEQTHTKADIETSAQESEGDDLQPLEKLESTEQTHDKLSSDLSEMLTVTPPDETQEEQQICESVTKTLVEAADTVTEKQTIDLEQEHCITVVDGAQNHDDASTEPNQTQPNTIGELLKEEEQPNYVREDESQIQPAEVSEGITSLQSNEDGSAQITECQNEEMMEEHEAVDAPLAAEAAGEASFMSSKDVSPVKQKDLEAVMGSDVGQSPSSSRTRGTWSPSASPSTSILKKGQKRPLEEESPSPLVKSRRVSFANPIQQQETADDIDRRSPAIRTSSPRRAKSSSIPQPKHVSTPTKGLLILSPRNLHSPGYKSSKKCLISEMGQEPRPVSKDCIYPPLVGCSAPVEAVLPQISSNMWSRGFGQLVRARNIKTVGDLSALTPTEIKTLPIRSPKVSNVRKALKVYEQQRKGRGGDELKSFDEMEMMTSEVEETNAPPNQEEEEKPSADALCIARG
ncbi:telomere-associated protein RIF1 isoform X2 [Sphaeramia orbicularis]|uniref:telomere-associated protein RIF1 isoform X2 n=1 Tax=Sphaeramia orbicularis TaxID=375764 RepID=UPI0011810C08|nr:telomere-associated protein RIF1 isoform X2 [Sphaeramia orbicularis]